MGCQSFCCRLLVRLKPHEMQAGTDGFAAKGYVDKTPDGHCIHMNLENGMCDIWEKRPESCKEYHCNGDPNLQVVLRYGVSNIAEVARRSATEYIDPDTYIEIPCLKD